MEDLIESDTLVEISKNITFPCLGIQEEFGETSHLGIGHIEVRLNSDDCSFKNTVNQCFVHSSATIL